MVGALGLRAALLLRGKFGAQTLIFRLKLVELFVQRHKLLFQLLCDDAVVKPVVVRPVQQ